MQCINKITYVLEMFTIQEIVFLSYSILLAAYSVLSIKQSGGNKQAGGRIFFIYGWRRVVPYYDFRETLVKHKILQIHRCRYFMKQESFWYLYFSKLKSNKIEGTPILKITKVKRL